jgi:hypothetical protein
MTNHTDDTHVRRRPGNPRLDEQRNTDVTKANKQKTLNADKYSRELFRSLIKFMKRRPADHRMSDFVEWLATEKKHTSPRGMPLRQEGVKRALKRVWKMEQFSLEGEGHGYDIDERWGKLVSLILGNVGLKNP